MALCGAAKCNCAVGTVAAIAGGISGQYPTIQSLGTGSVDDPFRFQINPLWASNLNIALTPPGTAWLNHPGPAVTQGVALSFSNNFSRYQLTGPTNKTCQWTFSYLIQSAGTAANLITVTLPVASNQTPPTNHGTGLVTDASPTLRYVCSLQLATSTTSYFIGDTAGSSALGNTPALTLAAGDTVQGTMIYEVA